MVELQAHLEFDIDSSGDVSLEEAKVKLFNMLHSVHSMFALEAFSY